jgi:hypothetical protein
MADLKERRKEYDERPDSQQDYELGYWAEKFGGWSRRKLKQAARAVALLARRVERRLHH